MSLSMGMPRTTANFGDNRYLLDAFGRVLRADYRIGLQTNVAVGEDVGRNFERVYDIYVLGPCL